MDEKKKQKKEERYLNTGQMTCLNSKDREQQQ